MHFARGFVALASVAVVACSSTPLRKSGDARAAELALTKALQQEKAALDAQALASGEDWMSALEMQQQRGVRNFVDGGPPRGGGTVTVVVTGGPAHPTDTLLLGVRIGTTSECIYARDVVQRAGASITPGRVYAAMRCVAPDQVDPAAWQAVSSPLILVH